MAAFSSIALGTLTAAQTVGTFAAQRQQARALEQQGRLERELADRNAALVRQQAADARRRGALSEGRHRRATRQLMGAQRAALAAQGVDIDAGSALDVVTETAAMGELDVMELRNRAALEAWGYEVQATDATARGMLAEAAAQNQARAVREHSYSTLLTGAADLWGQARHWRAPAGRATPQQRQAAAQVSGSIGYLNPRGR